MSRKWFKIGEAAKLIGVGPKELRYWESQIPEIQPRRSKGNLRYYHLDELPRLQRIQGWLVEGLTVRDCRELLLTGHLARGLHDVLGIEVPVSKASKKSGGRKAADVTMSGVASSLSQGISIEKVKAIETALKQLHERLSTPLV